MPTRAERPDLMPFQDTQYSWTDDLPVCKQSGTNVYCCLHNLQVEMSILTF